jgi:peptidoglycan/LPS O-acetylase OafA/YrhL
LLYSQANINLAAARLWLAIAVLLSIFANQSGAFGEIKSAWGGALSAFLQVANINFGDCWEGHYSCGPTFAYWSLSLEEQFYLFLPLLMIFSGKWLLRILGGQGIHQFDTQRTGFHRRDRLTVPGP